MHKKIIRFKKELSKAIVGQEDLIDALIIGLACDGHILVEGVPGLAKTTTINTFSKALGLDFKRIQFTPDLLPSDIIGAEIYNPNDHSFGIKKGPLFTHILLADEINRAPAKVQSALLEAMQEKQITIGDKSFNLSSPFFVMATQNPIEQEGVYALPEAQLDRFMMKVLVKHNTENEELEIMKMVANHSFTEIETIFTPNDIKTLQDEVSKVHIDEELERYIVHLVLATRDPEKFGLDTLSESIMHGVSPRGSIDLYKAAKACAFLRGNDFVSPADIGYSAYGVLRHRIILSYKARANGTTTDEILSKIIETLPIP